MKRMPIAFASGNTDLEKVGAREFFVYAYIISCVRFVQCTANEIMSLMCSLRLEFTSLAVECCHSLPFFFCSPSHEGRCLVVLSQLSPFCAASGAKAIVPYWSAVTASGTSITSFGIANLGLKMTCYGRFYVLGPPVPDDEGVERVVQQVIFAGAAHEGKNLRRTAAKLEFLEGPVRYDSSWVPGARDDDLRRSRDVAELWTGQIQWDMKDSEMSFSVIVMDYNHWHPDNKKNRAPTPSFETFVVGILKEGEAGVRRVYEWRTTRCCGWRNRGQWLPVLSQMESLANRRRTIATLQQRSWHLMYDVASLCIPSHLERPTRRQKKGSATKGSATHNLGWQDVETFSRIETNLPFGLARFLAALVERPQSFEELCRRLWESECKKLKHASMPCWYRATCATKHVEGGDTLQRWWWANLMGSAGNAVQQLLTCELSQQRLEASVVMGLSFRHLKTLGYNSARPIEIEALIAACHAKKIKFGEVHLGSGRRCIVRGVSTGNALPCTIAVDDADEDESF